MSLELASSQRAFLGVVALFFVASASVTVIAVLSSRRVQTRRAPSRSFRFAPMPGS